MVVVIFGSKQQQQQKTSCDLGASVRFSMTLVNLVLVFCSDKLVVLQPIESNPDSNRVFVGGGGEELMTSLGARLHSGRGRLQSADAWRSQLHCGYNDATVWCLERCVPLKKMLMLMKMMVMTVVVVVATRVTQPPEAREWKRRSGRERSVGGG